jgi:hypothetical protein
MEMFFCITQQYAAENQLAAAMTQPENFSRSLTHKSRSTGLFNEEKQSFQGHELGTFHALVAQPSTA